MASEIPGRGGIRPGQAPGQEPATLEEKQQATLRSQPRPLGKLSPEDAARLAQQAGLVRGQKKTQRGLELGDSSHAPIPIPDDDGEAEAWSPERLERAEQHMALASAQLAEAVEAEGASSLAAALASSAFLPTDEGLAALQALADRAPAGPLALGDATSSLGGLFALELPEDAPLGHKLLAAGLVVAGEAAALAADGGGLDERTLAGAIQKVAERSNQAVGDAQKMTKGVSRELSLQRTFVFKR